jgi:hypothetical protein
LPGEHFPDRITTPLVKIVLAFLLMRAPGLLLGAVAFALLTILYTPTWPGDRSPGEATIVGTLLIVGALALVPFMRSFALGFFAALLLTTVMADRFWTKVWWQPVGHYANRITAPLRLAVRQRKEKRNWIESWSREPLSIETGIFRMRQLQSGCVQLATKSRSDRSVPTAVELTAVDDCRDFLRDARDINAQWPDRYSQSDKGWRWTLAPSTTESRWGGAGFLLTFAPESLLQRRGPILELDGQDVLRIRESHTSPSRIATTPVPALLRLRECLVQAGIAAGDDEIQWRYLSDQSEFRRDCRDLYVQTSGSPMADGAPQLLVSTKLPPGSKRIWSEPWSVGYYLIAPRQFELRTANHYRRFLLAVDGSAHVTTQERAATVSDGPPLPCEVDVKVNCDR